ncbi:hypothetical protein V2A60_005942 [Cordyceps javanica]
MNGTAAARRIDAVDAFARTLYQRTKQVPPPALDDAAVAVRQMYISLRHLRVEAADPKSLLNRSDSSSSSSSSPSSSSPSSSFYAAELEPIVDHCEFALRQLETVLDRFDAAPNKDALADRIASITAKVAQKETDLAFFLDTIQTRPSTTRAATDHKSLPDDMMFAIERSASKVLSRHAGVPETDVDSLWNEFKVELERQDFTADQLDTHKALAQEYIRQLSAAWNRNCGATPTYQSVAEFEANTAPQVQHHVMPPVVPPKLPIPPPKEMSQSLINDKSLASIKATRQAPVDNNPSSVTVLPSQYSFEVVAGVDDDKDPNDLSTALVSTKDLVAMDSLAQGMNGMQLHADPYAQPGRLGDDLSRSPTSQAAASSPRYRSSAPFDPRVITHTGASPIRPSWLAPDTYGRDIPPDAQWTKIRRALVSPEVLDRAGVRYEARPEYVAVLGRLDQHQIAELARQSAECRAARSARPPLPPRRSDDDDAPDHKDRRSKRDTKRHHSDDDSLYDDSSDSTDYEDDRAHAGKGTRSYPYIVSAPPKPGSKTSPSTTVKPKPILKNRNENHVRFDPEPHEVEHPSSAPSAYYSDRRRDHHYHPEGGSSSSRRHRDHHYDRDYNDRGDRHHRSHRDRRDRKKKSWGETLGAVGIGSAALLLGGVGF